MEKLTPYTYGAPVVLLVCYDMNTVWKNPREHLLKDYNSGEQDAAIAAVNMMYAAEELGIHTLWARGFDAREVRMELGLPESVVPALILDMGYPVPDSRPHPIHFRRMPVEDMVTEL